MMIMIYTYISMANKTDNRSSNGIYGCAVSDLRLHGHMHMHGWTSCDGKIK